MRDRGLAFGTQGGIYFFDVGQQPATRLWQRLGFHGFRGFTAHPGHAFLGLARPAGGFVAERHRERPLHVAEELGQSWRDVCRRLAGPGDLGAEAARLIPGAEIPREALEKEGFTAEELDQDITIFGPKDKGCKQCNDGYKGRVGIFQVMEVSETMGRIIMEGGNAMQIADQAASEGVIDLRQAGLNKVKEGVTSLEEVNRVTIE